MRERNARAYKENPVRGLLRQYAYNDRRTGREFNLTEEWFRENIENKPCFYCETVDDQRGSDRLNNDLGHTMDNVVPCCHLCNKTRNTSYTPDEMKLLGAVIANIRKARKGGK